VDAHVVNLRAAQYQASADEGRPLTEAVSDERARRAGLLATRRWRSTTKRAANLRRLRDAIDEVLERHNPGAAPGIDPRRSKYHHLATKWCLPARITVVDYDAK
jgi:hypothetical protein